MAPASMPISLDQPLGTDELFAIDAWWRAANYLAVGQIYLFGDPLLRQTLTPRAHQAPPARSLGHDARSQPALRPPQPGHQPPRPERDLHRRARPRRPNGASTYLEGTYSEIYPEVAQDEEGLARLFRRFSFPGGMPSHCTKGIGIWEWASNDEGADPDGVIGCCGDVPTLEALAAVGILRRRAPHVKVRVVNVVDLMPLQPEREHPHGLSDHAFDSLFGADVPVIFNFHGYPWLIHRLTYRRHNHEHLHVCGYKEEGTTTTPFDMCVLNEIDRFHLVQDVIDRVSDFGPGGAYLREHMSNELVRHANHIRDVGEDLPEIRGWEWQR